MVQVNASVHVKYSSASLISLIMEKQNILM